MTSKKKPALKIHSNPVPVPTTGGTIPPKLSPSLDVRSTLSYPSGIYLMTTLDPLYTVPRNTPTPVPINPPIEPTDALKTVANNIIKAIPLLTAPISHELETVLLQLSETRKELKVMTSTYQATMPHTRKYLLRAITTIIKLLTIHLQDHPLLPTTHMNHLEPYECNTTTAATHRDSTNNTPPPPRLIISKSSSSVPRISPL